jgi:uncharacterized membrane protein
VSDGRETSGKRGGFRRPSQLAQVVGSILFALAIAAIAVAVVTAQFGSTPVAELEAREERIDARIDAREERQQAREDAREERQEAAEEAP